MRARWASCGLLSTYCRYRSAYSPDALLQRPLRRPAEHAPPAHTSSGARILRSGRFQLRQRITDLDVRSGHDLADDLGHLRRGGCLPAAALKMRCEPCPAAAGRPPARSRAAIEHVGIVAPHRAAVANRVGKPRTAFSTIGLRERAAHAEAVDGRDAQGEVVQSGKLARPFPLPRSPSSRHRNGRPGWTARGKAVVLRQALASGAW